MTSREAKRRLAYKNGNYLPIGISSRINLQPTRSLYHFRFKSYGPLCDFHWFLFKVTWHKNVTSYVKTDGRLQNRRSIRNICQPTISLYHFRFKNDPLCDFIVTWGRAGVRQNGGLTEAELYKERFATNPKSLSLPVQKLWPLSDFHKSGDLDLALRPIVKKKSSALSRVQKTSSAKEIRTIGQAVRPVEPLKTDRQTNRQTHTDTAVTNILYEKFFAK